MVRELPEPAAACKVPELVSVPELTVRFPEKLALVVVSTIVPWLSSVPVMRLSTPPVVVMVPAGPLVSTPAATVSAPSQLVPVSSIVPALVNPPLAIRPIA